MSMAVVDPDRVKVFKTMVKELGCSDESDGRYTFDAFCKENDLYRRGMEKKAGGIWIVCPFHEDSAPSLSFNQERGIWHCFGCNAGGTYLDFIYLYETEVRGVRISRNSFMNNILAGDVWLQSQLGFSTLFKQQSVTAATLPKVIRRKFTPQSLDGTYVEFQEQFMKGNPSLQEIKMFILMMQSGVPLREMKKEFQAKDKSILCSKQYDIEELGREDIS